MRQGWHDPGAARTRLHRSGRLYPHQRADGRAQHRAGAHRAVPHSARAHRRVADDDQQDAVGNLSRPRPLRGRLLSRAAVRHRRRRARPRPRRVPPAQSHRRSRDALPARHRRAAQHRNGNRQRRLRDDAGALPRRDRLERKGGDPGQADRRPLSRHRDRLLPRRRRVRPEGERAPRARTPTARFRSMSAPPPSARVSKPSVRRSPPMRWKCRCTTSRRCSTARPIT